MFKCVFKLWIEYPEGMLEIERSAELPFVPIKGMEIDFSNDDAPAQDQECVEEVTWIISDGVAVVYFTDCFRKTKKAALATYEMYRGFGWSLVTTDGEISKTINQEAQPCEPTPNS